MLIDFSLPEELIATHPSEKRDQCKMLVFDRATQTIHHAFFHQLPEFLDSNYFLVLNQAKVDSCRIYWMDSKQKQQEIVFLKHLKDLKNASQWEAIVSGKNLKPNQLYVIGENFSFTLLKDRKDSLALIQINKTKKELEKILNTKGELPLPPYILKKRLNSGETHYTSEDWQNYQTVFCKDAGAVAAPTAGLHFTPATFSSLKNKNIDWDFIHLSVGWGTFEPLNEKHFETGKLHSEFCNIRPDAAKKILDAKENTRKILAIGTTVARSLETWAQHGMKREGFEGETQLFVYPPFDFQMTDALLTNFHIPKSSLLLLVAAFLGESGEKKDFGNL